MRRIHSLLLILVLVIAPMFPLFMVPTSNIDSRVSVKDIPEELRTVETLDTTPIDDVELSIMYFTETPSSDSNLFFICRRGTESIAYFGESRVMYFLEGITFTLEFPGSYMVEPQGESPTGSVTNYFIGSDPTEWKSGIEDFHSIVYHNIYPGIDLVYKADCDTLKYEFIVSAGANPDLIQLQYSDADAVEILNGDVIVSKSGVKMVDSQLKVFQKSDCKEIECDFALDKMMRLSFDILQYDSSDTLIIDPLILDYSTYLGETGSDFCLDIAVEDGYAYITGYTSSSSFPTANANDSIHGGVYDCFVTKYSLDGQTLLYSTFLGGSGDDRGQGIDVENGFAYVVGYTKSSDFPVQSYSDGTLSGTTDCFVTKFSLDGLTLVYSTYVGGSGGDYGYGIAVDGGYAYVIGETNGNFLVNTSAYDDTHNGFSDFFVARIGVDGTTLWSTYLGGASAEFGGDIAFEDDWLYITGYTNSFDFWVSGSAYDGTLDGTYASVVVKMDSGLLSLSYSTFLEGSSDYTTANCIDVEDGFAYVTGKTDADDYPTLNALSPEHGGSDDVFVTKLNTNGQSLIYSTFLGGIGSDVGYGISVENGMAYVTGSTTSSTFPLANSFNSSLDGDDCFVVKLSPEGESMIYGTFIGGDDSDDGKGIAAEGGVAYIAGNTASSDFPTTIDANDTKGDEGPGTDCMLVIISEDSDMDSLSDWEESLHGTNPFNIDSDRDGYPDASEIEHGTDPLNPYDYPGDYSPSDYVYAYGTYLGGSSTDKIFDIEVEDGYIYLAGTTESSNFPMVNSWNSTYSTIEDIFLVKMTADGKSIIYSTFIGGNDNDVVNDIFVIDSYVYLGGYTQSSDFPTSSPFDSVMDGTQDAILMKFESDGSGPIFSTFLGGSSYEEINELHVEEGYTFVTGTTYSDDFPLVDECMSWGGANDIFVSKFAIDGQSLEYSTYISGTGQDFGISISVDSGNAYVAGSTLSDDYPLVDALDTSQSGWEGVLTKLSQDGSSIIYSSYIGGSSTDKVWDIHVDLGVAYLVGDTQSSDFPVVNELFDTLTTQDVFITKVDESGASLMFSTFFGGSHLDYADTISVVNGFIYISGWTSSVDFPATENNTAQGGYYDSFVSKFSNTGDELLFSGCYGGTQHEFCYALAVSDELVYFGGFTTSDDYHTLVPYNSTYGENYDAFLSILSIDSDFDGLGDFTEKVLGTSISNVDSDGDNFLDSYEYFFGSDPLDPMDYPSIPQAWYDAIYADLDGNATLIQYLITWVDGNTTLLDSVIQQLDANVTLLIQVISWLDGNHTAIETLFTALDGNASMLSTALTDINYNEAQILILAALISGNTAYLDSLNATHLADLGDVDSALDEIREVLGELGYSAGDSDYDGLDDLDELTYGTDILNIDTDTDNLNDAFEVKIGTDPLDDDSDADTYLDGVEVIAGTDPLDPLSYPGAPSGIDPMILVLAIGGIGVVVIIVVIVGLKKMKGRT